MDLRTSTRQLGAKEESNKKLVRCEVFLRQEESRFPQKLNEDWCEEVVEDGFGPCGVWQGLGISLAERWKLEQQMAAAAGK